MRDDDARRVLATSPNSVNKKMVVGAKTRKSMPKELYSHWRPVLGKALRQAVQCAHA